MRLSFSFRIATAAFLCAQVLEAAPPRVEMHRESFTSGGRRIGVETFAPAGQHRRLPAVLVLHSAAGTLFGKRDLVRFSRQLAAQGHVAFLVRYFDRTGTIFAGSATINRHIPAWMETTRDAVGFVVGHPRVDSDRIGMFGYSLGAYLAVTHSSLDPRIDVVAEVAGGIFEGYESRMRRLPPTLILHGANDERVRVSEAHRIRAAGKRLGGRTELVIYEGEGHRLSRQNSEDASRRALYFLNRYLNQ